MQIPWKPIFLAGAAAVVAQMFGPTVEAKLTEWIKPEQDLLKKGIHYGTIGLVAGATYIAGHVLLGGSVASVAK